MLRLNRHARLALITVLGVATLGAMAGMLYLLRAKLLALGYVVPEVVSLVILFGLLGAVYGGFAKLVLREAQRVRGPAGSGEHSPPP